MPSLRVVPNMRVGATERRGAFAEAGVTCRQLDHWTTKGWLRAIEASPGTGRHRVWPAGEVVVAALMLVFTDAGITTSAAARLARAHVEGRAMLLAPGISVTLD